MRCDPIRSFRKLYGGDATGAAVKTGTPSCAIRAVRILCTSDRVLMIATRAFQKRVKREVFDDLLLKGSCPQACAYHMQRLQNQPFPLPESFSRAASIARCLRSSRGFGPPFGALFFAALSAVFCACSDELRRRVRLPLTCVRQLKQRTTASPAQSPF